MAAEQLLRPCTIVLHDDRVSPCEVLGGSNIIHVGDLAYISAAGAKTLLVSPAGRAEGPDDISLHVTIAERYGFGNRVPGTLRLVEDVETATATHVELLFRDQHLTRADMWQIMGRLNRTVLYRGQIVSYLGTSTAEVVHMYHEGTEIDSAYISHPQTKPIFRSGSSRYTILVEISQEMLECWIDGELMYERLINGFLPELFERWTVLKARHKISVVLFGRLNILHMDEEHTNGNTEQTKDFFHVLTSDIPSELWRDVLRRLTLAFNTSHLPGPPSLAAKSNMLEAINLAAMDFADDRVDAQLPRTGTSIIAITAGAGLFDAGHALLKHTTDLLIGNSIGVDIVSLAPKPLHPVPLFKYSNQGSTEYALPHWVDISFWQSPYEVGVTSWDLAEFRGPIQPIALPLVSEVYSYDETTSIMDMHDIQTFSKARKVPEEDKPTSEQPSAKALGTSMETLKEQKVESAAPKPVEALRPLSPITTRSRSSSNFSSPSIITKDPTTRNRREGLAPHPLMQTGRKISLGPRGLAPTRGPAVISLSTQHVEKEMAVINQPPVNEPSGIAKQIRASLARKPSSMSLASQRISEPDHAHASKPINIVTGQETSPTDNQDIASVVERGIVKTTLEATMEQDSPASATLTTSHMLGPDREHRNEALDMLSPWVVLLNPCNPRRDNMRIASQYRKWQHIFPRAISSGAFKWSSMCTPAALPLTAEYRPTPAELDKHYDKHIRRHIVPESFGREGENASDLLERLIDARLVQGFQIVSIANSGSERTSQKQDRPILLALGRRYHELQRLSDYEIQVVRYEPLYEMEAHSFEVERSLSIYRPKIRMPTGYTMEPAIARYQQARVEDWTTLDEHIIGFAPLPETSTSFQIRLVLIPVDLPKPEYESAARARELSDDERRIEGIQRLTQMWQRQRHFTAEDQKHQASLAKTSTNVNSDRDPNPLAVEYHQRDPSAVVNAYGPILSNHIEEGETLVPLFPESEKHHSSNFDVTKLVKQMQEPPPYGVEMRDRRWLAVNHVKCFRGDEMTTWLLGVFKDLDLRDDAVAVGNELLNRGVFTHVRQKHKFRDGHYFYQIASAYRTTTYPDTTSLFSKAPWRSIPLTPLSEDIRSPMSRPISGESTTSSLSTPILGPVDRKQLLLSQILKYDVDPGKKSDHLQIIDLHYDRIHNPDNCYHITLEWLVASTKLVQIAVSRWSTLVESYGLKLVQVPLQEASKFNSHHPFDQPEPVKLAVRPPEKGLATPLLEPQSTSPKLREGHFAYHKALLRKNDFVLDYEAASAFDTKLHIRYSWGPLRYAYTQFLHRSGLVLAQIIGDADTTDFLLLPNRVAAPRVAGGGPGNNSNPGGGGSMAPAPAATPEEIIRTFRDFCGDAEQLRRVFSEAMERRRMPPPSPFTSPALPAADLDVPPMSLPPHVGHSHQHHRTAMRNVM